MNEYQEYRAEQIKEIESNLLDHFETLSDHTLIGIDHGITVHYNVGNGDVVVITGWPHDRARNGSQEYQAPYGWHHVKCEGGGVFDSTSEQQLDWLRDQVENWAELIYCSFERDISGE